MNKEAEELLKEAVKKISEIDKVEAIILFGSHAREKSTSRSDIDLFVVVDSRKPKNFLKPIIEKISRIDLKGRISPRVSNLKDIDEEFLETVLREGKLLYGKLLIAEKRLLLKPYILLTYDLSNLTQSQKTQITRIVYGYKSTKKTKNKTYEYRYKGLKDDDKVELLSEKTILLPENQRGFLEFLERQKIKHKTIKIWK